MRAQRAALASALALVILSGLTAIGFAARDEIAGDDSNRLPPAASQSPGNGCSDRSAAWMGEGKETAHCIASGTTDGTDWFYGAYVDDKGDLCDVLVAGGGEGGGCGPRPREIKEVSLGLSSGGPLDPALTVEMPADASRAFVELAGGGTIEMDVYDAPPEIPHSLKYGLLFNLPRGAERVVVLDDDGSRMATVDLEVLFGSLEEIEPKGDGSGWIVGDGRINGEPWVLDADQRDGEEPCVGLGLGNDERVGDTEVHALSCPPPTDDEVHLEQMWWNGLEDLAPVYGFVPRAAGRVTLEIEGRPAEEVEIMPSPRKGTFNDEYLYPVDFVVAFAPLDQPGRIVVYDATGAVLATWDLCLTNGDTAGRDYTACSDATEFWTPGNS